MTRITIAGVVLCGGESRRMGRDKASLPFGAETLLQRVVRHVGDVVHSVVVVAASNQILPTLPEGVIVVRDVVAGRGPWQGISAGLHALAGKADAAFVVSCDSPFLAVGWAPRLVELLGDRLCVVPVENDHVQPLAALYRLEVLETIDRLLADDSRPLQVFDLVPTRRVDVAEMRDIDPDLKTLRNLNTPDEYRQALLDARLE